MRNDHPQGCSESVEAPVANSKGMGKLIRVLFFSVLMGCTAVALPANAQESQEATQLFYALRSRMT